MDCLIVVDAWKYCEEEDLENFPWLEKETKLFGSFLNLQLQIIKENFDIDVIHCNSGKELMDEIDTANDLIVSSVNEIPADYNMYYFCGFHLGRCINRKIKELDKSNFGIILNLSMCFPEDSYVKKLGRTKTNNYFYSYAKGFEKCHIT
jgi:hypothetical protein